MADKSDLERWIIEALQANGGRASVLDVHKYVWMHHEGELRESGDLFYMWQYQIRWAAQELRNRKITAIYKRGVWELVVNAQTS